MLRFSLLTLAGFVAAVGMGCAALIHASPLMSSLAWTITVFALMLATLVAVLGKSRRRGFWTGFAIVGWLFTLITSSPLFGRPQTPLLTTRVLEYAALQMPQARQATPLPPPVYSPYASAYAPTTTPTYQTTAVRRPDPSSRARRRPRLNSRGPIWFPPRSACRTRSSWRRSSRSGKHCGS